MILKTVFCGNMGAGDWTLLILLIAVGLVAALIKVLRSEIANYPIIMMSAGIPAG